MTNPFEEVYNALYAALSGAPEFAGIVTFETVPLDDDNRAGVVRRVLTEGDELRIALRPGPGRVRSLSSTSAEVEDDYELEAVSGTISLHTLWQVKWALLKAFWRKQLLDLDYVSGLEIALMEDVPQIGTDAVAEGAGPGVSWTFNILIRVTMVLTTTELPDE